MDGENTEQREKRRRKIDKRSQNLFSALLQVTLLRVFTIITDALWLMILERNSFVRARIRSYSCTKLNECVSDLQLFGDRKLNKRNSDLIEAAKSPSLFRPQNSKIIQSYNAVTEFCPMRFELCEDRNSKFR
ncbi:hypothetical protein QL285_094904 [Trifolium repens]|nr:hypothetical protein QL285_094904 [Trifolium repens]